MPDPELTLQVRRELVAAAIARAENSIQEFRDLEADAYADAEHRHAAKQRMWSSEREFGCQWRNVKAILSHLDALEAALRDALTFVEASTHPGAADILRSGRKALGL